MNILQTLLLLPLPATNGRNRHRHALAHSCVDSLVSDPSYASYVDSLVSDPSLKINSQWQRKRRVLLLLLLLRLLAMPLWSSTTTFFMSPLSWCIGSIRILSVLSRPDSNGVLTSVTTMQGINEKILSLNYKDFTAEIKTADAQQSLEDAAVVLVTGYLTGRDSVRKKFAQSFFLATQEKGYYVLNDVFRYVDDDDKAESVIAPADGNIENVQAAIQTPQPESNGWD